MAEFLTWVRTGGEEAVRLVLDVISHDGRSVLRAYAERAAARAVQEDSVDHVVAGLIAGVLGGADRERGFVREALMAFALLDDAARRLGEDPDEVFRRAAALVGEPSNIGLETWTQREYEDRVPAVMGFAASGEGRDFRYVWVA